MSLHPWQQTLLEAGANLFEVGGTVRDGLLGHPPKDRDYLVTGTPMRQLESLLRPFGKVSFVGKSFGVLKLSPHREAGVTYDIAIPRKEVSTGSGHRDFSVTYDHTLPIEEDLLRRDFTINAMARHVTDGTLIDPYGGAGDLQAKLLRQVFPNAFREDPLRLLRAIQFAARFGFTIEEETFAAMQTHAELITTVSPERIIEEVAKLFRAEKPSLGFDLMGTSGLLTRLFPELAKCIGVPQDKQQGDDVYQHTMRVLDAARSDAAVDHRGDLTLLFAALFHDVGKPQTRRFDPKVGRVTFYGHQLVSKRIARRRLSELKVEMLGVDPKAVCRLVEHHMFQTKASYTDRAIRRFVQKIGVDCIHLLLDLRLADNRGGKYPDGITGVLRLKRRIHDELAKKPVFGPGDLAINGRELMDIGIPAGPGMGAILKQLVELCLDDPALNEREKLLALAGVIARSPEGDAAI